MCLTSLFLLFRLRGGAWTLFFFTNDTYMHELPRDTEDDCCLFNFLVGGVCGYNTRLIESVKRKLFLYFHAPGIHRPVEGGGGFVGSSSQKFWKLKKHYNK